MYGAFESKDAYLEACKRWRVEVRAALFYTRHKAGIEEVSDNDVYQMIFVDNMVAPPPMPPEGERVGLARPPVFREAEAGFRFYEPTGRKVKSIDPLARGRMIMVFRYTPEFDPRCWDTPANPSYRDWGSGDDDF